LIHPRRVVTSARRTVTAARLRSALSGRGSLPPLDLELDSNGAVQALVEMLRGLNHTSSLLWWVRADLDQRGTVAGVIDGLTSPSSAKRIRCARVAGVLRLEDAVPWLGRLLANEDSDVQAAAARALGTIRGARSADALVRALYWRRGGLTRIVLELARSAPDRYLESAILAPEFAEVRFHLAMALGLRGRKVSVPQLLIVYDSGVRSERVAVCRALGWIGDTSALPMLKAALEDQSWQVRAAALKALTRIGSPTCVSDIEQLLGDRYSDVRWAAEVALRRLAPAELTASPARSEAANGRGGR
jgi:HEAT repeat protein